MRLISRLATTAALILSLGLSTMAGNMPNGVNSTPPPAGGESPFPQGEMSAGTGGHIETGMAVEIHAGAAGEMSVPGQTSASVTQSLLTLLRGLLPPF